MSREGKEGEGDTVVVRREARNEKSHTGAEAGPATDLRLTLTEGEDPVCLEVDDGFNNNAVVLA